MWHWDILFLETTWSHSTVWTGKTREGCSQATSRGEGAVLHAASGPGNLVWGHEPCVPKGPECNTTVGSDHQVGDAAVVEGQAEPTFWGKLQCSGERKMMMLAESSPWYRAALGSDKVDSPVHSAGWVTEVVLSSGKGFSGVKSQ